MDRTLSGAALQIREDLGAMVMKEYSALPKAQALFEPRYQIFSVISRTFACGSYPSAEKQSVYSTASAGWAK